MEQAAKYEVQTVKAEILNMEDYAMSVEGLVKQVQLIQQVMDKVMREGEHYGTIPGTEQTCTKCSGTGKINGEECDACKGKGKRKRPTLLKPGAEKLCLTFRLDPHYEIIREIREKDWIAYTVKCSLFHILSGKQIASGVGSCNTRETKHRYRYSEESTGQALPKEYWKAREKGDNKEMKRIVGEGNRAAKIDGVWVIAKSQKIENDNPWDLDNTIIKMACKRALVAATLNATAASDIFTQDLEDIAEPVPPKEETPVSQPTGTAPQQPTKDKSLFEQLMSARGNFAKLVSDNKDALLDFLPDELKAVKERWEAASAKGLGGVTKGSPWPIQEAVEDVPLFDVEEPNGPPPSEGAVDPFVVEAEKYQLELSAEAWHGVMRLHGMVGQPIKNMPKDKEVRESFLTRCKNQLNLQNAKK